MTHVTGTTQHLFPEFLPDGRHFVFTVQGPEENRQGIFLASLDNPAPRRLLPDVSSALFAPSNLGRKYGYLLFLRGKNLMAQPFDPQTLELAGDVAPAGAEGLFELAGRPKVLASVSSDGALLGSGATAGAITSPLMGR